MNQWIVECKTCGQKFSSPVPTQEQFLPHCSECTFNEVWKSVKATAFPDRIDCEFPRCPETGETNVSLTFSRRTGIVLCRRWKKCKGRNGKECLEVHTQDRIWMELDTPGSEIHKLIKRK